MGRFVDDSGDECRICHRIMFTEDGLDPTDACHTCRITELEAELAAARARIVELEASDREAQLLATYKSAGAGPLRVDAETWARLACEAGWVSPTERDAGRVAMAQDLAAAHARLVLADRLAEAADELNCTMNEAPSEDGFVPWPRDVDIAFAQMEKPLRDYLASRGTQAKEPAK